MRSSWILALALLLPAGLRAQPATSHIAEQVVEGLSRPRADRMMRALSMPGGVLYPFREKTGSSAEDVRIGVRWEPAQAVTGPTGWSLRGRLRLVFVKNPSLKTRFVLWWSFNQGVERPLGFQVANTADMKFLYDKVVHVRYLEAKKELRVTLEDAGEEHGSFNLAINQVIDATFAGGVGGSFGVNARSLSVDVQANATQVTVVVAGLPYVVRPILELQSIDRGDYLMVAWGLIWESKVKLTARTEGVKEESGGKGTVTLGWGTDQAEVKLEGSGYSKQTEYDSSVTLESGGDGMRAVLVYDERVPHRAYELVSRANQQWQLHVDASPIVRVGSIQEERSTPIGLFAPAWPYDPNWLPSWPPGGAPTGAEPVEAGLESGAADFAPILPLLRILMPKGLETEAERRGQILTRFEQSTLAPSRGMVEATNPGQ